MQVAFSSRHLKWERPLPPESGGGFARHTLKVDAFPIGIDPDRFRRALKTPAVKKRIAELQQQFAGMQAAAAQPRSPPRHGTRCAARRARVRSPRVLPRGAVAL